MSVTTILNRGIDGLNVSLRGLGATSNNIANINTKGYARQQIIISQRQTGDLLNSGGGAEVTGIVSVVNPFVEMQLFTTGNAFGTADGRQKTVTQIENIWADSQQNGIGRSINEFFNTLNALSNNAGDVSLRQSTIAAGQLVASHFNTLSNQLTRARNDLGAEIQDRVTLINDLSENIATLNDKIAKAGGKASVPDLAAQRTYLLRLLSEEININYTEDSAGNTNVTMGNGLSVVQGASAGSFSVSDDSSYGGTMTVSLTPPNDTNGIAITSAITGGRLAGNLTDRNTNINTQISNLDALAFTFVNEFNDIHDGGYGLDGSTGNAFFAVLGSQTSAAANIAVDATIANAADGYAKIACAGSDPTGGSIGDNENIELLVALRNTNTMASDTQTFTEYYRNMVGSAGETASAVRRSYDLNAQLMNQTEIQRESVSGVNLDEEGTAIIQYQRAFQASSKLITVADELMDTIIRI